MHAMLLLPTLHGLYILVLSFAFFTTLVEFGQKCPWLGLEMFFSEYTISFNHSIKQNSAESRPCICLRHFWPYLVRSRPWPL